jgi:hypothetical protein
MMSLVLELLESCADRRNYPLGLCGWFGLMSLGTVLGEKYLGTVFLMIIQLGDAHNKGRLHTEEVSV